LRGSCGHETLPLAGRYARWAREEAVVGWWRSSGMRLGLAGVAVPAVVGVAVSVVVAPAAAVAASPAASAPRWTGSKLPLPAGAAAGSFRPLAISCSSEAHCAGGGSYAESGVNFSAALLTLSGEKWTDVKAPLPAGANQRMPGTAVVSAAWMCYL